MKPTGYIVMETAEDFEQGLRLVTGDKYPKDGILPKSSEPRRWKG